MQVTKPFCMFCATLLVVQLCSVVSCHRPLCALPPLPATNFHAVNRRNDDIHLPQHENLLTIPTTSQLASLQCNIVVQLVALSVAVRTGVIFFTFFRQARQPRSDAPLLSDHLKNAQTTPVLHQVFLHGVFASQCTMFQIGRVN